MLLSEVFFVGVEATRLTWLARRISRMYWQEVPYRALSVARGFAQSKGLFAAAVRPESVNPQFGAAWCSVPGNRDEDAHQEAL